MNEKYISVREWQAKYKAGDYSGKDVSIQVAAGWFDWFCDDNALPGRLKKLAPLIMGIAEPFILDNYRLWLKNNCPVNDPLYDDVRFEPLEGERDGKYFLVSRDCPHYERKWSLITERFGFDEPEYECANVRDMIKYVNRLGYELKNGIIPDFVAEAQKGKLYIAYGSNLNLTQMKHRCPTAKVMGKSVLKGYRLNFRGSYGGGVATVEPEEGSTVPVLIWYIYPKDEKALDRYEGAPRLYRKENISVELNGETVEAMIYIMNDGFPIAAPSRRYYDIIAEGYASADFDIDVLKEYVNESIPKEDCHMTEVIRQQIMDIRDSGEANMFELNKVLNIADREDYSELVDYIEKNRRGYVNFILYGDENGGGI